MPTAIDNIKEAEARAAQIRADALQKSREDLRTTQEEIAVEQKERFSLARQKAREELESSEKEIAQKQAALSGENQKEKEQFKSNAKAGVEAAAKIIVKEILGG